MEDRLAAAMRGWDRDTLLLMLDRMSWDQFVEICAADLASWLGSETAQTWDKPFTARVILRAP
jgi:hypothetical protein